MILCKNFLYNCNLLYNYNMINNLKKIIEKGETQKVEFKRAAFDFPKDAFETICAFLNTDGGILLLGVTDDCEIEGVLPDSVGRIKDTFSSSINNPLIINPTVYIEIQEISFGDKTVICLNVPASSSVHRYKNKIYKRNGKSDLDITNNHKVVSDLYFSKDTTYTENKIYRYLKIEDLRQDLINRVKVLAKRNNEQNDWSELDNEQFWADQYSGIRFFLAKTLIFIVNALDVIMDVIMILFGIFIVLNFFTGNEHIKKLYSNLFCLFNPLSRIYLLNYTIYLIYLTEKSLVTMVLSPRNKIEPILLVIITNLLFIILKLINKSIQSYSYFAIATLMIAALSMFFFQVSCGNRDRIIKIKVLLAFCLTIVIIAIMTYFTIKV